MGIRYQAFKDFLSRYISVWRNVWVVRDQLDLPERDENERAFLPAHLELTETPVSPAPKWAARLIMLFALSALVWSLVEQIDIVAASQGKTVPSGRSKTIQLLETAVVKSITVENGQHIKAGQVLVTLEGIGSDSDYAQSVRALQAARLSKLRQEAVLAAVEQRRPPQIDRQTAAAWQLPEAEITAAQILAQNQYQAWLAQDEQLQTALRGHQAELRSAEAQARKLEQVGRIENRRTEDFRDLLTQNFISRHAFYEQESKSIQNQNDLALQRSQIQQIKENIRQAEQSRRLNAQTLKRGTFGCRPSSRQTGCAAGKLNRKGAAAAKPDDLEIPRGRHGAAACRPYRRRCGFGGAADNDRCTRRRKDGSGSTAAE